MIYYVYQLVDPRDGVPFYVGKGKVDRAYIHLRPSTRLKGNREKCRIVAEIYEAGMIPVIEFLARDLDEVAAYDFEVEMIKKLGKRSNGGILVNFATDRRPPGMHGKTFSEETRRQWSEVRTGKRHSQETKLKMGLSRSGEKNAYFGKTGCSHPITGFKHSTEERNARSKRRAATWEVVTPDNQCILVKNLMQFCFERSVPYGRVYGSNAGWSCRKLNRDASD